MSLVFRSAAIVIAIILSVFFVSAAPAADNDKPHIFINTGNQIGFLSGENFGQIRFGEFARAAGFTIDHGVHSDLVSGSPLDGIDVYILFDPNFPFPDQDKIALRQWVRAGGILITSSWYANSNRVGGFVQEFGVEFGQYKLSTKTMHFAPNSPLSKPLSVSSMMTRYSRYIILLDDTRSEALLNYDNGTIAATRTIANDGKGEIIVFTCLATLYDPEVGGDISLVDNAKLIQNLLTYIKNKLNGSAESGYDLSLLKTKFKKGTTFLPGDDIKFVARIRNIGTDRSEDTRVVFFIDRVGASPSMRMEIASSTVPEITAKKKTKIVKKAFLPDDLEPGTYEVLAVIDPDELTDDANTGNNSATAKKKIVIQ